MLLRFALGLAVAFASSETLWAQEPITATPLLNQISYDDPAAGVEAAAAGACQECDIGPECCGCESCCGCDDLCCEPLWTVRAGAVILSRVARSATLFENSTTGAVLADGRGFGSPWSGGPDITLRRRIGDITAAEVRYFSVDGWSSDQAFTVSGDWQLPTTPPLSGSGPLSIAATNQARLFSTEINLRRRSTDWMTLLAGFRWIELHENMSMRAVADDGALHFNTDNHLYGAQLGADFLVWDRGGPFRAESIFKGGIFGNSADNVVFFNDQGVQQFGAGGRQSQVAFVGEIGVTGVYQMTQHLALRGGYQLLWIEGVAVAAEQVAATNVMNGTSIYTGGGEFFHGALVSLDFTW